MTKPENSELKQRRVLLKKYSTPHQLEQLLTLLKRQSAAVQLTLLGKVTTAADHKNETDHEWLDDFVTRWRKFATTPIEYGVVTNPEIGTIFIVGSFADMFLQEINGKKIGSMTTGIYGVLRGLGIDQEAVNAYINALSDGTYLIILRGYDYELRSFNERIS